MFIQKIKPAPGRWSVTIFALAILIYSCGKDPSNGPPPVPNVFFAKGSDVSWLTEMEASGIKFYDKAGSQQDLFQILKSEGINAIRLRVWAGPTDGWCNTKDVVAKALRATAAAGSTPRSPQRSGRRPPA